MQPVALHDSVEANHNTEFMQAIDTFGPLKNTSSGFIRMSVLRRKTTCEIAEKMDIRALGK